MRKFYIITNESKDCNLEITNKILHFLTIRGIQCKLNSFEVCSSDYSFCYTNPEDVDDDTECVIVIGGDGTLIQASRDLRHKDVSMIGVNLGNLGYLAEIERENLDETLQMILDQKYRQESRMMLDGVVIRDSEIVHKNIALNDVVFGRCGNLRVVDFEIYVNGEFLNCYSADGVIITTPTGSTAYNLSAGGPILEPCADIIAITPICSHTLGSRSIVLSADSEIKLVICPNRHLDEKDTKVYFDGNSSFVLKSGDTIEISKSRLNTKILKLNRMSFVEVLHKKMN